MLFFATSNDGVVCCSVLQCFAVCCTHLWMLFFATSNDDVVCCSVQQRVAVCFTHRLISSSATSSDKSSSGLQVVAVSNTCWMISSVTTSDGVECCRVLQSIAPHWQHLAGPRVTASDVLQRVAACCSVLHLFNVASDFGALAGLSTQNAIVDC